MFDIFKRQVLTLEGLQDTPGYVAWALNKYLNTSGMGHDLSKPVRAWLRNEPDVRPDEPVTLYRGLFFASDPKYTGNTGEKFLRGHKVGDNFLLSQRRCSSWSSDRLLAQRYALNSSKMTFKDAWADFNKQNTPEEKPLGVVMQATIPPVHILCEIRRLVEAKVVKLLHGNEDEFIIEPFPINTKIVDIYRHE